MRKFGSRAWSESKLDCVEEYASKYLKVMQEQTWCQLDYIDAFAGRGTQVLRSSPVDTVHTGFFGDEAERADTEGFLIGSAIRALRTEKGTVRRFDGYLFIDSDEASCDELKTIVEKDFPEAASRTRITCGDANAVLREYVRTVDWRTTRALVFLDPYGLEVEWGLIETLAATQACDVWYLFPLGGVIRLMANNGQIPDAWATRLDRLFGTGEWREEFFKPSVQQSLFRGDEATYLKDAPTERVVGYVRNRLATAFAAVSDIGVLRNTRNAPLFALVLGVSNRSLRAQKAALGIANNLVRKLNRP